MMGFGLTTDAWRRSMSELRELTQRVFQVPHHSAWFLLPREHCGPMFWEFPCLQMRKSIGVVSSPTFGVA